MKKIILTVTLLSIFRINCFANSIPNVWTGFWGNGGISVYSIFDSKGQSLEVSCAEGSPEFHNHVSFTDSNGKEYTEKSFALLIDGNAYYLPNSDPDNIFTRNEENQWVSFRQAISKGKKIEVYMNNKSVASFVPTQESIKEHISYMYDCPSKSEKMADFDY